jgi:hypothetical protein
MTRIGLVATAALYTLAQTPSVSIQAEWLKAIAGGSSFALLAAVLFYNQRERVAERKLEAKRQEAERQAESERQRADRESHTRQIETMAAAVTTIAAAVRDCPTKRLS